MKMTSLRKQNRCSRTRKPSAASIQVTSMVTPRDPDAITMGGIRPTRKTGRNPAAVGAVRGSQLGANAPRLVAAFDGFSRSSGLPVIPGSIGRWWTGARLPRGVKCRTAQSRPKSSMRRSSPGSTAHD